MRRRALVVDAVPRGHLVDLGAELHVHTALEDDQQLLGLAVGVRLVAGRAARGELGDDDLEKVRAALLAVAAG